MRPRGRPLVAAVALAAAAPLVLSGCGGVGGLESAGPTPTAVGPVRLWPDLPPASEPPLDYGETDTQSVPGIKAPDNDVHRVDAVAVVRAEVNAHPDTYSGADGMYEETARQIGRCTTEPAKCPVMQPYYRDLTGNGRDELIVGIRMPDQQVGLRVYLAENDGLTRVMSTIDQVISVELAGRDVIVRAASAGIPGYEYRTAWSWDEQQRAMLPTRDEIVRVKPPVPSPSPTPEPRFVEPTAPPSPSPTPSPSADVLSGEPR
ncbi:hypothetical protein [Streptomyces sp. NBC_01353]|uniref:hypothetical protein n=1 Tax=Streptomyces sp. NBC_01353 TaxID=2903835 RepID=UPI002E34D738|nr:hypothetical protein [Streptomyces sp. NBC_01353]